MDVLDMVFPGILLQQFDRQHIVRENVLDSTCSSRCSMSTPTVMGRTVNKSLPITEPKESFKQQQGSSQQPSNSIDVEGSLSSDVHGASNTSSLSSDLKSMDKPVKKIKKKNKKKGMKNLKNSDQVVAEPGRSRCAQDIATTSSQPSEDLIGNEKDESSRVHLSLDCQCQNKSQENDNIKSSILGGCNGGISHSNNDVVTPSEQNNTIPQSGMVNKPRCEDNIQIRKENIHSIRRKNRKHSRDERTHWVKRSNVQRDFNFEVHNILVNHLSNDALLPSRSAGQGDASQRAEEDVRHQRRMCGKPHVNALPESVQWVPQRFHTGLNDPELGHRTTALNTEWRKTKSTLNQSFRYKNNKCRKQGISDYNEDGLSRNKIIPPPKVGVDVSGKACEDKDNCDDNIVVQVSTNSTQNPVNPELDGLQSYRTSPLVSGSSDQALLPSSQSYNPGKIPEQVLEEFSSTDLDNGQIDPALLNVKLTIEDNIRKGSTSQSSIQKWIPIGIKNSRTLSDMESVGASDDIEDVMDSFKEKAQVRPEESMAPVCEFRDSAKGCLMSGNDTTSVSATKSDKMHLDDTSNNVGIGNNEKGIRSAIPLGDKAKGVLLQQIGSQTATEALHAAYRLQIAAESIQLATGSPLAEFERLLYSATPVIAPAVFMHDCDVCLGNQLSSSCFCNHQIPDIPLSTVWSWYEKPGNYGLEVKAHDLRKLKGLDIDPVSFNAHFVPLLSAVQLFGHPHLVSVGSKVQSKSEMISYTKNDTSREKEISASVIPNSGDTERSLDIFLGDGNDSMDISSVPTYSSDMELIFEFFEDEQPQKRKPLYEKVMELVKAGTANNQVFGDPAKLQCMNLHDLHPASWFSVAWYPIYRIPEGNFRASFLTYHSLGHLVQRNPTDFHQANEFCVVSPVLGLQSYNAQGECWFYPNNPVDSSKGVAPINSSDILKERLRTLEETALLFARGCVYKDQIKVTNRQPDYEFFLSRKRSNVF